MDQSKIYFDKDRLINSVNSFASVYRPASKYFSPQVYNRTKSQGLLYIAPENHWPYIANINPPIEANKLNSIYEINYVSSYHSEINKLKNYIDPKILREIQSFPNGHFAIERFIWAVRKSYALKLLRLNPILGFLISNNAIFRPTLNPIEVSRSLIPQQWKKILAYLGFPESTSFARNMSRFSKSASSAKLLLNLRNVAKNDDSISAQLQSISGEISVGVLSLLTVTPFFSYSKDLLLEIANDNTEFSDPITCTYLRDIYRMKNLCIRHRIKIPEIPVFCSKEEVIDVHNIFLGSMKGLKYKRSVIFPVNPYLNPIQSELVDIRQIKSSQELLTEGKEMQHCIYTYRNKLLEGKIRKLYVYKMTKPERLTILIKYAKNKLSLEEVRGIRNQKPTKLGLEMIESWISSYNYYL